MRCQHALNVLAVNLDLYIQQSRRNSGDSLRPRQLIGSVTMAAAVLQRPDATRAAVEEFYNFLETFRALGAGASVT